MPADTITDRDRARAAVEAGIEKWATDSRAGGGGESMVEYVHAEVAAALTAAARAAREQALTEAAAVCSERSIWAAAKITTDDDPGQFGTYSNACDDCEELIRALMNKGEPPTRWRHRQRGTVYEIVGTVRVQCPPDAPMQDDEEPLLYRDANSGYWGARREAEFHDGRFEKVAPQGNADAGGER